MDSTNTNTMTTTAQQLIDAAIISTTGKVGISDAQADDVYASLKPHLVRGSGCTFNYQGYHLWLDCNADGEQFLYARELPILG